MMARLFIFICLFSTSTRAFQLDESQRIFFPRSMAEVMASQTEFPYFWWNFVVIEPQANQPDWEKATRVCEVLKGRPASEIKKVICGNPLGDLRQSLIDWSRDLPYRESFPTNHLLREKINESMSQFYLISGQPELISILRHDPFLSWQKYLSLISENLSLKLKRKNNFLLDPLTSRLLIPIQMSAAPSMKTAEPIIIELSNFAGVNMLGAHASSYFNELQVRSDLAIVSWVGTITLLGFILFLILRRRAKALWLIPPVIAAVAMAAYLTSWIYGSIHGLTLSLGSGIIGLAIDYGLHGAFHAESKQTWKSNFVGLLTTMAGLLVLIFSQVPLIQQMMVFSLLGLILGFATYYFLYRFWPKWFNIEPLQMNLPRWKKSYLFVMVLIAGSIFSFFKINLNLDLKKFDYQTTERRELANWFYSQFSEAWPLIILHDKKTDFQAFIEEAKWSQKNSYRYDGIGKFLPPTIEQTQFSQSWEGACKQTKALLAPEEMKIFSPFIEFACQSNRPQFLTAADLGQREYLRDFVNSRGDILSGIFVKDLASEYSIKENYPQAHSLRTVIFGFSEALRLDLSWMIPMALLLVILILGIYYRRVVFVFTALVPFLSGMGLVFLISYLFNSEVTLITVIGLIIVFGFSIDYGVFGTDTYVFPQGEKDEKAVWSALTLAALTNILGFAPLLMAHHPVLKQLGFSLFYGTIGTFVGSAWAVPDMTKFFLNRPSSNVRKSKAFLWILIIGIFHLALTWTVCVSHSGVFPEPNIAQTSLENSSGVFIPKSEAGIHQLILEGGDYQRGVWAGRLTKELLRKQETELKEFYFQHFPSRWIRFAFEVILTRWFSGIESFIPKWAAEEMKGVSLSAPDEFKQFGDNLTRQVIYHGLHEVGQMMVDSGAEDMACTVLGINHHGHWILGRNFDFEGGRTFDRDKMMKWVFPTRGYPYLSVIWAGMVGAVTGVNSKGVYVSLNAAGSEDFRRHGTPATLIVTEALQNSLDAFAAAEIIRKSTPFITYLFVVADSKGNFLRIEKTPNRTVVLSASETAVVSNHLISPEFQNDKINAERSQHHTSHFRLSRGLEILQSLKETDGLTSDDVVDRILAGLRDKSETGGRPLPFGNRRAIDALIATHSVVYDSSRNYFFVGTGPGVTGTFQGYDLAASFREKKPVLVKILPPDNQVSEEVFNQVRSVAEAVKSSQQEIKDENCQVALQILNQVKVFSADAGPLYASRGNAHECLKEYSKASEDWKKSLELRPAYFKQEQYLKEKIAKYEKH